MVLMEKTKSYYLEISIALENQEFKMINQFYPIYDALRDLVPFVQFKKREKHPWRVVNFSKVAGFSLPNRATHYI